MECGCKKGECLFYGGPDCDLCKVLYLFEVMGVVVCLLLLILGDGM